MTGHRATLAGTLVVATACLATLALIVTTCVLYLRGDLDGAKDAAVQGSGALAATLGLLAVTGRDRNDDPVPVTTAPGDAVAVEPAPAQRDLALQGFDEQPGDLLDGQRRDGGHADVASLVVIAAVALIVVVVYDLAGRLG